MTDETRIQSMVKRNKLPSWVTVDESRENAYIVDVNKAYPFWQQALKGKQDKYWAEVYRRCTTQFLKDLIKKPIIVCLRDASTMGTWALANLEGTKEDEVSGASSFYNYYSLTL